MIRPSKDSGPGCCAGVPDSERNIRSSVEEKRTGNQSVDTRNRFLWQRVRTNYEIGFCNAILAKRIDAVAFGSAVAWRP